MTKNEKLLAKAAVLLNKRGTQFTSHSAPDTAFQVQASENCVYPHEPYRLKGLRLVIAADLKTMHTGVTACKEGFKFDRALRGHEPMPAPVHESEFTVNLAGLGHVAAANRLQKLLDEMVGIHNISGLDHA